ncbi:MAG: glycosyltransferase [Bauldia sp.]
MERRHPTDRRARGRAGDDEAIVYAGRARRLGLPFAAEVHLGAGTIADIAAIRRGTFAMDAAGGRLAYLAPDEDALPLILRWLRDYPEAGERLRVATPSSIRAALVGAAGPALAWAAVGRLAARYPDLSARRVGTAGQMLAGILLAAIVGIGFRLDAAGTLVAVNLVGAAFFFGISALRFVAAGIAGKGRAARAPPRIADRLLPVYTILVPLYREADLVADMVKGLAAIDWPRDRLDIKLLLEADDAATIAAARRVIGGAPFEIVIVPPGAPRTKPKALAFALSFARGEFVTVYDAEDRPHPQQLRQAHAVFAGSGEDLACLQSALVIDNDDDGWLPLLFAIEYAALFDGLLPALARFGMPLPLGGTSNHFRRAVLERIGGWDPFNVTEDADIGFRLARFGYRSACIDLPTLEDAPVAAGAWFRQRTRWFKGWMQTWLVHTRHPRRLARELGLAGSLGFTLVGTGVIVSAMIYPVYVLTVLAMATDPLRLWGDGGVFDAMVFGVNLFNLVGGFTAMTVLARRSLSLRGRRARLRGVLLLPAYWMMMSLATYRAVAELALRPHHWEKTPHRRHRASSRPPAAHA